MATSWGSQTETHSEPANTLATHWEPATAAMFPQAVWGSLRWELARALRTLAA
jgi:hypothetical protein